MQLENVLYFLVFAGLFFVMMRFGCGAHIMGHAHHHGGTRPDDHGDDANLRWVPPGQAVDPVCGMTVQTADAINRHAVAVPHATPSIVPNPRDMRTHNRVSGAILYFTNPGDILPVEGGES